MPERVIARDSPNNIIYNNRSQVSELGPSRLNEDFYLTEARDLTEKERRRDERQQKRKNNKIERQRARNDRRLQRQKEKDAENIPPSYF
jgi:hypothetical protein